MAKKKKYKFSLTKKIVFGIVLLSSITYGTSAFVIIFLKDYLSNYVNVSGNSFIIFTLSLGILWSAIFGYIASKIITKPLIALEQIAKNAATGDLRADVKVVKSDDELRALGIAFNKMLESFREIVRDINQNFEETNSSVHELTLASEQTASSAESISITIEEIAKGAERQATASNSTLELVNQVNHLSQDVNSKANQTKDYSYQMEEVLNESIQVIHGLVEGLIQIVLKNQESIQVVERLQKNADEIGAISGLVGDIAEQTNLLALNASIEAARAGEHGAGFAVVANEVRKLADESTKSVKNISSLIEQMQIEVKNVVARINEQVQLANQESERGGKTKEALSTVSNSVDKVVEAINDINHIVEKQVDHIQNTLNEAHNVAAISDQTSAGAQQVASATEEQTASIQEVAGKCNLLSESAYRLKDTISKFQI